MSTVKGPKRTLVPNTRPGSDEGTDESEEQYIPEDEVFTPKHQGTSARSRGSD